MNDSKFEIDVVDDYFRREPDRHVVCVELTRALGDDDLLEFLTPDEARGIARELLASADEAERMNAEREAR